MRTWTKSTALLGGVALLLLTALPAGAQGPIIEWGPNCFGWETDYSGHISGVGSELTIVGKIDAFFAPFDDLDPVANEYTFMMTGLTSLGTAVSGGILFETSYSGGTFKIYEDTSADFDFGINPPNATSPSTFIDGTVILEGTLSNFYVALWDDGTPPGASGSFSADWVFTAGTLYDRVEGCWGQLIGGWTDDPAVAPIPAGYHNHADGKFDLEDCPPTGTEDASWGSVKTLFR